MIFITVFEGTDLFSSFRLVPEGKTGKEILKSSRLGFLEKCLGNKFILSDAEDNTSLNIGGIADLHLFRTLIEIGQKSWELGFLEVMESFALLAYVFALLEVIYK